MEDHINKITLKLSGHPVISIILYYLVMAFSLRIAFACVDEILIRWAVDGLFGGLISVATIGYLVAIAFCLAVSGSAINVYNNTGTAKHINIKHPKICNGCRKVIYWLLILNVILIVYEIIMSIYQVFISHEIAGYAANIGAAVYYNLSTLIYALFVLTMLYIIFDNK